jgi:glycosyltransferase involved in cell wall biosynthesis
VSYEAAAIGLPLLTTDVNGVNDLLVDGENGWFITPEPADIARRLDALSRADLRAAMARASLASRRSFSWGDMAKAYESLYQRLSGPVRTSDPDGSARAS